MQINVLRELRQPIGTVTVIDFEEPSARIDGTHLLDLRGSVSMLRTDAGLLVTLTAEAHERTCCSRCLKEIEVPIEINFEEEYVPVIDANTGAPIRPPEADTFRIAADFKLDLHEAAREYILMSEPAKPLCRAECPGLCPNCGADLNQGGCGCATEADARWQALTKLKTADKEGR
jgi:uncharacterized protein